MEGFQGSVYVRIDRGKRAAAMQDGAASKSLSCVPDEGLLSARPGGTSEDSMSVRSHAHGADELVLNPRMFLASSWWW